MQIVDKQADTKKNIVTRSLYIESYGCAMNFSDSEIIASILAENGYESVTDEKEADVILLNTCAIRDNAEQRIRTRLMHLKNNKRKNKELIIGVLGCMAERLKDKLLEEEKLVDIVAGPDSYRDLPRLLAEVEDGARAINVLLSREETYAEISPVRLNTNGVNAFVSIMRGCDNMCSFCVVPFTRGRERSRSPESIVKEVQELSDKGYKEIVLLGQNVDSYLWFGGGPKKEFSKLTLEEQASSINFPQLLEMVANVDSNMRIRFSTSHPKDITDEVMMVMNKYDNICKYIHLPAQSGSSRILDKMNRTYDREWYLSKVERIRALIPDCGISCDIITGFCSETEEDHQETLTLMEQAQFDFSYMYFYSERPGTLAAKKYEDDVPEEVKKRRLSEVIALQNKISKEKNARLVGKTCKVLVEGTSKKSAYDLKGRNDQNAICVFPAGNAKPGDYVTIRVERSTTTSLIGTIIENHSL
jgi:tRNA-2-methylthio-N6-dimethylallyladenosine synthase